MRSSGGDEGQAPCEHTTLTKAAAAVATALVVVLMVGVCATPLIGGGGGRIGQNHYSDNADAGTVWRWPSRVWAVAYKRVCVAVNRLNWDRWRLACDEVDAEPPSHTHLKSLSPATRLDLELTRVIAPDDMTRWRRGQAQTIVWWAPPWIPRVDLWLCQPPVMTGGASPPDLAPHADAQAPAYVDATAEAHRSPNTRSSARWADGEQQGRCREVARGVLNGDDREKIGPIVLGRHDWTPPRERALPPATYVIRITAPLADSLNLDVYSLSFDLVD